MNFMKKFILITVSLAFALSVSASNQNNTQKMNMKEFNKFEFPQLPYAYDALEPYIDKLTVEIHYSKHQKAYFDNFVNAIKGTELEKKSIEEIFASISSQSTAVRNNGGGFFNHVLYWENMKVNGGKPSETLQKAIEKSFGSMEELKKQFTEAGKTRFGSGWAWLSVDKSGNLFVSSTPNQDNPIMDVVDKQGIPILAMDVWEHAYYLKYQNKRPDYIEAFWNIINWEVVSKRYDSLKK